MGVRSHSLARCQARASAAEELPGEVPMAEAEACVLSSAVLTPVFTHVYLRDPNVDLDSLLEPASGELSAAATEAVKGRAEALLAKFHAQHQAKERRC